MQLYPTARWIAPQSQRDEDYDRLSAQPLADVRPLATTCLGARRRDFKSRRHQTSRPSRAHPPLSLVLSHLFPSSANRNQPRPPMLIASRTTWLVQEHLSNSNVMRVLKKNSACSFSRPPRCLFLFRHSPHRVWCGNFSRRIPSTSPVLDTKSVPTSAVRWIATLTR